MNSIVLANNKLLMLSQLSQELLLKVKKQENTKEISESLEASRLELLKSGINSDEQKKAFWINIYNAYFLILRKEKGLAKPNIYRDRIITISGKHFSLDDIEHGILRQFRYKYSLGYLKNPFTSSFIKSLAVSKLDYRIHFALNCGALSCPPIRFYTHQSIEEELDVATASFLESETSVDDDKRIVWISALFKWYHRDFGGNDGIRSILNEKLNLDLKGYKIKFSDYSWEEKLDNFS